MKPVIRTSLLAAFLTASLSACVYVNDQSHDSSWQSKQQKNRELINNLEINTERYRVLERLGTPYFSEAFTIDNQQYRVLHYRTHRQGRDGETRKNGTTPLVFKADRLIGWGQSLLISLTK